MEHKIIIVEENDDGSDELENELNDAAADGFRAISMVYVPESKKFLPYVMVMMVRDTPGNVHDALVTTAVEWQRARRGTAMSGPDAHLYTAVSDFIATQPPTEKP